MTLDEIIREYLIESGENTLHKYSRYLQYGISGLRQLNMDVSGIPKLIEIKINPNNTADLPLDYISFVKLAICGQDGTLHHLGFNKNLCVHTDKCGDIIANNGTISGFTGGGDEIHFRAGESVGRYFGVGGGTNRNGYYKLKESDGYIILNGILQGTRLFLEYLADIQKNEDGKFEVHPYIIETIKLYIAWKSMQFNIRLPANRSQLAKHDYNVERGKSQRRFASFTKEEALQTIRKTFSLAPKF